MNHNSLLKFIIFLPNLVYSEKWIYLLNTPQYTHKTQTIITHTYTLAMLFLSPQKILNPQEWTFYYFSYTAKRNKTIIKHSKINKHITHNQKC